MSKTKTTATEPRKVAYIPGDFDKKNDGFRVAFVTEGSSGYSFTGSTPEGGDIAPWYWGPKREDALRLADEYNKKRGISSDDVAKIIIGSMRLGGMFG